FFQAEDGIRDFHVTGVQTCALPISSGPCPTPHAPYPYRGAARAAACGARNARESHGRPRTSPRVQYGDCGGDGADEYALEVRGRSEERRVGKECRCGRWVGHEKSKA